MSEALTVDCLVIYTNHKADMLICFRDLQDLDMHPRWCNHFRSIVRPPSSKIVWTSGATTRPKAILRDPGWSSMWVKFAQLALWPRLLLLVFPTTYLVEQGNSQVLQMNRLNLTASDTGLKAPSKIWHKCCRSVISISTQRYIEEAEVRNMQQSFVSIVPQCAIKKKLTSQQRWQNTTDFFRQKRLLMLHRDIADKLDRYSAHRIGQIQIRVWLYVHNQWCHPKWERVCNKNTELLMVSYRSLIPTPLNFPTL